jgi:polyisoprenoid-binding protein YceI
VARRRPGKPRPEAAGILSLFRCGIGRAILLLLLLVQPARAEQLALVPPGSQVAIRVYGLGLIPMDGRFSRFHGWMRYDPARPNACQVILEIEAASLEMSERVVRDTIIGPEFMDVMQFPRLAFHGACQGDAIAGDLLLHGQTHPFSLDREETRSNGTPEGTMVASGRLHRADWGMTARRFTAGSTIRIRVEIPMNGPPT